MSKTAVRETKAFPFQAKDFDDAQGIVRGYLSTFDNVDDGGDRVKPGAFKRTLANKYAYKQKHGTQYLMPLLWQHDTGEPIGGYVDAKEDDIGLFVELQVDLDVQRGREAYSGLKKGYIFQQSMGYDCLQSEYVKVDGKSVRDLLEVRLWEGSIVTFPMNELAVVTDVKSVCGSTSFEIGPRDESWDGSKAHNQIVKWASKDDGSVDAAKMKQVHLRVDGDADKITSYSYPFCYIVSDKPRISVGGVKACAGALSGARNADAGEDTAGMQRKVETLYNRINKLYPDDPELTPPWKKDDGKAARSSMNRKTLLDHYNEEQAEDLLEDWQDVFLCSLTCAILDALKIGDQVEADISQALDDFKTLVMGKFVTQAQEVGLTQYLQDSAYSFSPADSIMQYGSESSPAYRGLMSASRSLARKAGRSISAANADKIQGHADSMHDMATKAMDMMKAHTKALHAVADDLASMTKKPDDETDTQDGQDTKKPQPPEEKPPKKAASLVQARGAEPHPEASTVDEQELEAMLRRLRELRTPAENTTIVA